MEAKMLHMRLMLSTVLLFGLELTGLQAQTMYVKQSIGMQASYALSSIRKMTFSEGNISVQKTDNTTGEYGLSGLRYLNFTNLTSSIDKPLQVQEPLLNAFPNPVRNVLCIDLTGTAQGKGTLSMYNFEGKFVLSQQLNQTGVHAIDISHLPNGIYLCRFSNETDFKTVKIIKQ
jgi:hypothetical protein